MEIRIILNTHDPEVIAALDKIPNRRPRFVEMALLEFVRSEKGIRTIEIMMDHSNSKDRKKKKTPVQVDLPVVNADQAEQSKSGKINIDDFLK